MQVGLQGHPNDTQEADSGARCVCLFTAHGNMDMWEAEPEGSPAAIYLFPAT